MSVPVTTGRLLLRGQSSVVQIIRKGSDRKRCCVCTRVRECVRARVRVHNCRERNSTRGCLSPALSPVGGSARATELREGERLSASHSNASGRPQFPEMFSCSEAARPPAALAGSAVPSPSPRTAGFTRVRCLRGGDGSSSHTFPACLPVSSFFPQKVSFRGIQGRGPGREAGARCP